MQELKSVHRAVARELALGLSLKDICSSRGLNFASWCNITSSELFKGEVRRFEQEIEDSIKEEVGNDAVMAKLKSLGTKSVDTLGTAMDMIGEQSASAVSAAKIVLESLGYKKKEEIQKPVVINISQGKMDELPKDIGSLDSVKI